MIHPHTKAILTDIEGTTSSISFVKEVLFPFAKKRIGDYIQRHREELEPILQSVKAEKGDQGLTQDEIIDTLIHWIDTDQKVTPLKTLQGMIWKTGYHSGELKGHMYPDAVKGLNQWKEKNIALYVYSSGSIAAQKLLFAHTEYGDLTPLFSGYFDTTSGPKKESTSYTKVASAIGHPTQNILFLSDHQGELEAAQAAGMTVILLDRENVLQNSKFDRVTSFDPIQ